MAMIVKHAAVDAASIRPTLSEDLERQRREALAAAIEDAALELFAAQPIVDVTVEQIARRAGVGVRTLYRYFPGKEEILLAFPERGSRRFADALRARPADESPFDALRAATQAVLGSRDARENDRWLAALAHSTAPERTILLARGLMADAIGAVLAERTGAEPEALWPAIAGALAATAMQVGAKRWMALGGDFVEHQLAALDVARSGFDGPSAQGS